MPKLENHLSGNKGEWSEIYVFFYLLAQGRLYAADKDLNKLEGVFYDILKIVRDEGSFGSLEFRVTDNAEIEVFRIGEDTPFCVVTQEEFEIEKNRLYDRIIEAGGEGAFCLPETETFLNSINVHTLKAKSEDKADIRIQLHDFLTGMDLLQGFSIKSRLGSPSTLLNAGNATNFVYEVVGRNMSDALMDAFNKLSKFKDKFQFLKENLCDIRYSYMDNETFNANLILLDSNLPEICAHLLKLYYFNEVHECRASLRGALDYISIQNPMGYKSKEHKFYHYKIKRLLSECAVGMLPSKVWDGRADATGGYIVVREDGEVLCYHLFNRNEFEEYLLSNTKFETASSSRYNFGTVFKKDGKYFVKLNLQVRFVR